MRHLLLAAAAAATLTAQAVVPAQNLVVLRRQQAYGSSNYSWVLVQDGSSVGSVLTSPYTLPAGKRLVITGLRYTFTGSQGVDVHLGPFVSGVLGQSLHLKLLRPPVSGSVGTTEHGETFTTGLALPPGAQLDLKVTKVSAATSDTLVWCYLFGYLE